VGEIRQVLAVRALLRAVDIQLRVAVRLERRVHLTIPVEGPHQDCVSGRQCVSRHAFTVVSAGMPEMPGLPVAVHEQFQHGFLGNGRQPWGDESTGENFVVVRVPITLLFAGQLVIQGLGNDELYANEIRILGVAIEYDTLEEVFVYLLAVVVRFHLHVGHLFGAVEADHVDVEFFQRRRFLQQLGPGFKDRQLQGLFTSRWPQLDLAFLHHRTNSFPVLSLALVHGCVPATATWPAIAPIVSAGRNPVSKSDSVVQRG
jgi:hypothetical protein